MRDHVAFEILRRELLAVHVVAQLVLEQQVGEAGGVPPSYAIISDYFPSGMRGRALAMT